MIAAAATGGALLPMGSRAGGSWRAFNAIAGYVLGRGAHETSAFDAGVTVTGLVTHVVVLILVGLVFAVLDYRWGLRRAVLAAVFSGALLAFSLLSATFAGIGLAAVLPLADLIVLHTLLGVALSWGMRFAFVSSQNA
jgi:hypothetical protein